VSVDAHVLRHFDCNVCIHIDDKLFCSADQSVDLEISIRNQTNLIMDRFKLELGAR
jgi:hypothetical protein